MPTPIPMSPRTNLALRTLLGRSLSRLFERPDPRVLRELRHDARRLVVTSPDGRTYSGVLVIEANEVTTGLVVPALAEHDANSQSIPSLCESTGALCEFPSTSAIEAVNQGASEDAP